MQSAEKKLPLVVAGEDISGWEGVVGCRILPDGRIIVVYRRPYNAQLTVSTPQEWPHTWSDGW